MSPFQGSQANQAQPNYEVLAALIFADLSKLLAHDLFCDYMLLLCRLSDHDFLGRCQCTLAQIVSQGSLTLQLQNPEEGEEPSMDFFVRDWLCFHFKYNPIKLSAFGQMSPEKYWTSDAISLRF